MGLMALVVMFFLSLFGLVSSGMLMKKYNDANDTTSTGYKYTIFSLVFFILAVLGTIVYGAVASRSGPVAKNVPASINAAAAPRGGVLSKLENLNQKLS